MRPKTTIPNLFKIRQNSRINLHIEQTNIERISKNKTSLEDVIKSRLEQIKTQSNINSMNILRNYRFLAQTVKTLYLEPKQEKPIQPNFAPFNNTNKSI